MDYATLSQQFFTKYADEFTTEQQLLNQCYATLELDITGEQSDDDGLHFGLFTTEQIEFIIDTIESSDNV